MYINKFAIALIVTLALLSGAAFTQQTRDDGAPKVGDVAPTFTLEMLYEKGEVSLDSFKGKKPVVLIFGSYT